MHVPCADTELRGLMGAGGTSAVDDAVLGREPREVEGC